MNNAGEVARALKRIEDQGSNTCSEFGGAARVVAQELRRLMSQPQEEVPADCDVRKILLRVVPGDGSGVEVYARNAGEVEALLSELSNQVEEARALSAAPAGGLGEVDAKTVLNSKRYEWLRDRNDPYVQPRFQESDGTVWQVTFYSPFCIQDESDDNNMDSAIDAAIAAAQGEGK